MRPRRGRPVTIRFFREGQQIHQQVEKLKPIQGRKVGLFGTPLPAQGRGPDSDHGRALQDARDAQRARQRAEGLRGSSRSPATAAPSCGCCSAASPTALLDVAQRDLRQRDRTGGDGVAQDDRHGAHVQRVRGRGARSGRGSRRLPGPLPQARAPRRGRSRQQVMALIDNGGVERSTRSPRASRDADDLGSSASTARTPGTTPRAWCTRSTSSAATRSTDTTSVPTYPASHGCLRKPIPDACPIFNWIGWATSSTSTYGGMAHASTLTRRRAARARAGDRRGDADQRRDRAVLRRRQAGDPAPGRLRRARRARRGRGAASGSATAVGGLTMGADPDRLRGARRRAPT